MVGTGTLGTLQVTRDSRAMSLYGCYWGVPSIAKGQHGDGVTRTGQGVPKRQCQDTVG